MKSINVQFRPSFAYWGLTVILNGGLVLALFVYRLKIAGAIIDALRQARVPSGAMYNLPYWLILGAIPLLIIARTLLWALTTEYKIAQDKVRIVHGGLMRKEQFVDLASIKSLSFEQNLVETLFKVGRLVMTPYRGTSFTILGVPDVSRFAEDLRERLQDFPPPAEPRGLDEGRETNSSRSAGNQPQQIVVQQKSSGCMTCLVILLIIIVLPTALGIIFNVALFTSIVTALTAALSQFLH